MLRSKDHDAYSVDCGRSSFNMLQCSFCATKGHWGNGTQPKDGPFSFVAKLESQIWCSNTLNDLASWFSYGFSLKLSYLHRKMTRNVISTDHGARW